MMCYRDDQISVLVTSASMSLKMVSVAAITKQDSIQIVLLAYNIMPERFYLCFSLMFIKKKKKKVVKITYRHRQVISSVTSLSFIQYYVQGGPGTVSCY